MRMNVHLRRLIFLALVCVCAGSAHSQDRADRDITERGDPSARSSPTVSIAALRIPEKAWQHFQKARFAAQHNQPEAFDRESNKALQIAPNFAAAYLLRANQHLQARSFEAAIADVELARKAEPGVMWASVLLAGADNGMHRYHDAQLILEALHGPEADTWQARYERARAAIGTLDMDAALYWSSLMLQTAPPEFPEAHLVRTNALILSHRLSEAETQMKIYLGSKGPQLHHDDVIALLRSVQNRMHDPELAQIATK